MIAGSLKRAINRDDPGRVLEGIVVGKPFGRNRDQSRFSRDARAATQVNLAVDGSLGDIDGFENHFATAIIAPGEGKKAIRLRRRCVVNELAIEKTLDATSANLDLQV